MTPVPTFLTAARLDLSHEGLRSPGVHGPVTVTPDMAAKILDALNVRNRPISWRKVGDYSAEMLKGNWRYNPSDAIGIDVDAELANGQHRLLSVLESGTTQRFAFATGVEKDVQDVMDSGIRRTTAHQLSLAGYSDANALAAIARIVLRWNGKTLISGLRPPTTPDVRLFVEQADAEALKFAIDTGKRVAGLFPLRAGVVGAASYTAFGLDSTDAVRFFDDLCVGAGLSEGDPALTLRNYLVRQSALRTTFKVHHQLWLIVSTWNTVRAGRRLMKIMSPSEWNAESFPFMR